MSTNGGGTRLAIYKPKTCYHFSIFLKSFTSFYFKRILSSVSLIFFLLFLNSNLIAWVVFQMSEIKNEMDTLPLRAMLAAAFITYLSAAPEDRRRQCLEMWTAQSGLQSRNYYINT